MASYRSREVRAVTKDELGDYMGCLRTAFLGEREVTTDEVAWRAPRMDLSRTFCAFEENRLCGTARTFPAELTVPGGVITAAAVTEVTVLPTHTRRGHLRAMMRAMLDDAVERREPMAILTASEWPIYWRFGFGPASERVSFEVRNADAAFRETASGTVAIVGIDELRSVAPDVYESIRLGTVGALGRNPSWWDEHLGVDFEASSPPPKNRVRAVWRDDSGRPRGYVVYDTNPRWTDGSPDGEVFLKELVASSPEAHRELWRYLCTLDLVGTVHAAHRPVDEPVAYHLVDGRAVRYRTRFDHLWVCLLDVQRCLSARRYSAEGRIVVEIVGAAGHASVELRPRSSRIVLEVDRGRVSAYPTGEDPDLVVEHVALGAAFLGGTSFAALSVAGRVSEHVAGSVARADSMFGVRPAPYLTTNF